MATAVTCVGADAARVARALSGGSRRASVTRAPLTVELVLQALRASPPDLVVLGSDGAASVAVAEALVEEPAAEATLLVAWGAFDPVHSAQLTALGATVLPEDEDALSRACAELLDARDGRTVRLSPDEGEGVSLHGRRVLVAEDDPAVAWYFGDALRRAGCDVEELHDGWDALDRARRTEPDVVLTDIRMPGLDGLRLCRALRSDPLLGDVPVVLLSWKEDWLARAREQEVGATAYLGKHAVPEDVVEQVRGALGLRVDLERRFRAEGAVRGLLSGVAPYRLLRLSGMSRPDARVTLRSGPYGYEVHLRGGAPVSAVRVSPGGDVLRGTEALGALLSARGGRFVVTTDRSDVPCELTGSLQKLAAPHVAAARSALSPPAPTPSIPIVVAATETIRLASPAEASVPVPLVRRAARTAPLPRPSRLKSLWRAALRALSLLPPR